MSELKSAADQRIAFPPLKGMIGVEVPLKLVDVGAGILNNSRPPYYRMIESGAAHVIGFEPNPAEVERLNERKGANPHESYLPYAIGDGKEHTLNLCVVPGMSSLFTPNMNVLGRFHGFPLWAHVQSQMTVQTVRLDDVPEIEGADFLQIDIQGAELMALENAEELLQDMVVVQSEVEFLPMYIGQPLFSEVEQYMRAQGFVLHRFTPLATRVIAPMMLNNSPYSEMSQVIWSDAIFIKDFTKPDLMSDHQLLAMARIMHELYGSYDLVLHLLLQHDERRKTGYAPQYMQTMYTSAGVQAA